MDAGIADTINRRDARLIADRVYLADAFTGDTGLADVFLSDDRARKAWLLGRMAPGIPGLSFDGAPADADWDSLFSNIESLILIRRDPKPPHARSAATRPGVVV